MNHMTTKKQAYSDQTKQQIEIIILDSTVKQKPETTAQLIKLVQEKTTLSPEEIKPLLIQLENENKLHFTKKEPLLTTPKSYLFSTHATWYWITIALAAATAIAAFTISNDAYPSVYLRSALSIGFILFLPGFALLKMLYPSKNLIQKYSEDWGNVERITLSIGLSLALVPIVGLILNYTPWGIRLTPIALSILTLTVFFATVAMIAEYQAKIASHITTTLFRSA
jgi:hypothetical protein